MNKPSGRFNREISSLRWAMGADIPDAAILGLNDSIALQAILRHRLTARILARIRQERPSWATSHFLQSLEEQQIAIEQGVKARLTEIRSLGQMLADLRPAIIKGPTAYLITQDKRHLRFSNDIDLLTDRPRQLSERAIGAGYQASDDYRRSHEFSSLYRNGINVDVHRYFPVIEAPPTPADSLIPEQNPGIWRDLRASRENRITYEMILSDSAPIVDAPGVLRVGPTVGYLLACTHIFREYHDSFALLPYATIRLGELCEAMEMRQHDDFDSALYADLIHRCQAEYSIQFTDRLSRSILDDASITSAMFSHDAWLPGFTVADERASSPSELLIRSSPADQYIADLGFTTVNLDGQNWSPSLRLSPSSAEESVERLLIHGEPAHIATRFSKTSKALLIDVSYHTPPEDALIVLIAVGDYLYELTVDSLAGKAFTSRRRNAARPRSAGGTPKWKASIQCAVCRLGRQVTCSIYAEWNLIGLNGTEQKFLMLFGARFRAIGSDTPGAGYLLPLRFLSTRENLRP